MFKKSNILERKNKINLLLATIVSLIVLIIGEISVRYIGYYDIDGNFFFNWVCLKPLKFPIKSTKDIIDKYESRSSFVIYDPVLGWTLRPNSSNEEGICYANSLGIRTAPHKEYSLSPPENILRIMICGDSFTFANDVPFENSWGFYLEKGLQKAGIPSEVINLGVPAYGIDQAFLRWKKIGRQLSPQIVILGFMPYDIKRDVNMIRKLMYFTSSQLPFSKPRFIEKESSLELINVPAVPPEKMIDTLKDFKNWEFADKEFFYNQESYEDCFWFKSKLISLIDYVWENKIKSKLTNLNPKESTYDLNEEPTRLSLKIIKEFRKDVESKGGQFFVYHLIPEIYLKHRLAGQKLIYSKLLKKLETEYRLINSEDELLREAKKSSVSSLFYYGHYNSNGNKIVADVLKEFLSTIIANKQVAAEKADL